MSAEVNYAEVFATAIKKSQQVLAEFILPDSQISEAETVGNLLNILDDRKLVVMLEQYQASK